MIRLDHMEIEYLQDNQRKKIPQEIEVDYAEAYFVGGEKCLVPIGWTCPECGTYRKLIGRTPGAVCLTCGQNLLITEETFKTK